MSSMMMMERPTMMSGMSGATMTPTMMPNATTMGNVCMLPRCTMKFEKCTGGMKVTCSCEDEVACGALQNLCKMLAGGMCSFSCMMNGMCVCSCNMCCGTTKCEMTKDGCCVTCTSGDKACCEMLQACCDCLTCCMKNNCMCCMCFGGTPVCCCTC